MIEIEYSFQVDDVLAHALDDAKPVYYWTTPKRKIFISTDEAFRFLASYVNPVSFRIVKEW